MSFNLQSIEDRLCRLPTQYRESPKFKNLITASLIQIQELNEVICSIPSFFNLNDSVGDQLTITGKLMGFRREHCVCTTQPVYGFQCPDGSNLMQVVGFCDENGVWSGCDNSGTGTITITDDEVYRRLLQSRSIQMDSRFDLASLCEAVMILWGEQASVVEDSNNTVTISIGRELTPQEQTLIQIYPRVLPVSPNIQIRFSFGVPQGIFGFGEGFSGFCEDMELQLVPILDNDGNPILGNDGNEISIYQSVPTTEGIEVPVLTNEGDAIQTNEGNDIILSIQPFESEWLCKTDVAPYGCI